MNDAKDGHAVDPALAMSLALEDGTGDLIARLSAMSGVKAKREVVRLALAFTLANFGQRVAR